MAKNDKPVEGKVKARVLVTGPLGNIDDVVEVDVAQVESLAGVVDASLAAVAYAEGLKA